MIDISGYKVKLIDKSDVLTGQVGTIIDYKWLGNHVYFLIRIGNLLHVRHNEHIQIQNNILEKKNLKEKS